MGSRELFHSGGLVHHAAVLRSGGEFFFLILFVYFLAVRLVGP